ncbi:hypothetical protein DUF66_22630, partial [Salmonella enterica]|nr:hypothetical protein [Salmonella enterica]
MKLRETVNARLSEWQKGCRLIWHEWLILFLVTAGGAGRMNMTRRLFFITGAERDRTADVKPGTVIYPDRNMKPDTDHRCLPQPVVRIILQTMKMPLNIYSSSDHDNMQK